MHTAASRVLGGLTVAAVIGALALGPSSPAEAAPLTVTTFAEFGAAVGPGCAGTPADPVELVLGADVVAADGQTTACSVALDLAGHSLSVGPLALGPGTEFTVDDSSSDESGGLTAAGADDGATQTAGIQTTGATLVIAGGTVHAWGGWACAGIGGSRDGSGGTVLVTGGTVHALGGFRSPGIGAGLGGSTAGAITIAGGVVEARGGQAGAGIGAAGGVSTATGATITITGGTVTATGGADSSPNYSGAGIDGGGATTAISSGVVTAHGGIRSTGGTIAIDGGTITATGSADRAGIGGGTGDEGGAITIAGGTVTATGGTAAAGIGGGYLGAGGGVTITGGVVEAMSGFNGAGIGGGTGGLGGVITITGGTVTATGGGGIGQTVGAGAGIGGGAFGGGGGTITLDGGTVTATAASTGAGIGGGYSGDGAAVTIGAAAVVTTSSAAGSALGGGDSLRLFGSLRLDGVLHVPSGALAVPDSDPNGPEIIIGPSGRLLGAPAAPTQGAALEGTGQILNGGVIALDQEPTDLAILGNNSLVTFHGAHGTTATSRVYAPSIAEGHRSLPSPPVGTGWVTGSLGEEAEFAATSPLAGDVDVRAVTGGFDLSSLPRSVVVGTRIDLSRLVLLGWDGAPLTPGVLWFEGGLPGDALDEPWFAPGVTGTRTFTINAVYEGIMTTAEVTLEVLPAPPAALAVSGADTAPPLRAALVLLTSGLGIALLGARRRARVG